MSDKTLPDWAADLFRASTIQNNSVKLPKGQLPREQYVFIASILENIGGKWKGGKVAAHIFPFDPADIIDSIIESRILPEKNPLDFFPTPKEVIKYIIDCVPDKYLLELNNGELEAEFVPDFKVLEPSAGAGHIVETLIELYPALKGKFDVVEANPLNVKSLESIKKLGFIDKIFEADFLKWNPAPDSNIRIVVMNPPFSCNGNSNAYIEHIKHAWEILQQSAADNNGLLISVVPTGWTYTDNKKTQELRNLVALNGGFFMLPDESFAASGTKVNTAAIYLHHEPKISVATKEQGCAEMFNLLVDNTRETYDKKEQLLQKISKNPEDKNKLIEDFIKYCANFFIKDCGEVFPNTKSFIELVSGEL